MAWFKLDDRWHSHRKVIGLSLAARGLWATLGSWCASELNGGRVPEKVVKHFGGTPRLVTELVESGLWVRADDGYQFHDWSDHQPSKEDVYARRLATSIRVSRHRERHGRDHQNLTVADTSARGNGVTNAVTNSVGNASPGPARPGPYKEERESAPLLHEVAPASGLLGSLEQHVRIGFSKRLESAAATIPNQRALGALTRDLVPWAEQTAPLRKLTPAELIDRVLDGFFRSDSARLKSYPPAFLAQNPLEYLQPTAATCPRVPDGIPPIRNHAPKSREELYPLEFETTPTPTKETA
jgi:hypothetical protein